MLTGSALRTEATRLNIPGRSKMSADQLRAAIAAVTDPIPPATRLSDLFGDMPPVWDQATIAACDPYAASPAASDPFESMPFPGPTANHMRSVLAAVTRLPAPAAPFRARNGKRKPSLTSRRRTRR